MQDNNQKYVIQYVSLHTEYVRIHTEYVSLHTLLHTQNTVDSYIDSSNIEDYLK
jgi:hypothetical protein